MIHKMVHNILNIKAAVTYVPYQDLENKFLLLGLMDTPNDFLNHIRRSTYSFSTQMIFGYRSVDIKDPTLQQLFTVSNFSSWPPFPLFIQPEETSQEEKDILTQNFETQNFERWAEFSGNASAQIMDLYPILQKLPKFIAPSVRYAEKHFAEERQHYVGHWMKSKEAIDNGTGLVSPRNSCVLLFVD